MIHTAAAEDTIATESEVLKVELSNTEQKCEALVQQNEELKDLVELKESEYNTQESLVHELQMKLEKSKVELGEALKRVSEVSNENDEKVKKFDILTDQHKNVQNDLRSIRAENDIIKKELKQANKEFKIKDKEQYRLSSKIDNLETVVKNLKQNKKDLMQEKVKISKECSRIQKELSKIKERRPSESKATTTVLVYSSEASTSTVATATSVASSNTSPVNNFSQISQTNDHPEIPYTLESHLPGVCLETIASMDPTNKSCLDPTNNYSLDLTNNNSLDLNNKNSLDLTNSSSLDHTCNISLDPTYNSSQLGLTTNSSLDFAETEDYAEVFDAIMELSTKVDALGLKYDEFSEELKRK